MARVVYKCSGQNLVRFLALISSQPKMGLCWFINISIIIMIIIVVAVVDDEL